MNLRKVRTSLLGLAVVATAGVVPLLTAAPASATSPDCRAYLTRVGYDVGPKVTAACENAAIEVPGKNHPNPFCFEALVRIGVTSGHAAEACSRA
jgi:hypothetical protein